MAYTLGPKAQAAGYRVACYETVGSTSNEAFAWARLGDPGRLWVTAQSQTHGYGRRGRAWQTPLGNLAASLLMFQSDLGAIPATLGFVAGLALDNAIRGVAGAADAAGSTKRGKSVKLKWPNDLLCDGAKVAGILLEAVSLVGAPKCVVIGIGVNVREAPTDLPYPATSLAACGIATSPEALFQALAEAWVEHSMLWNCGRGFGTIRERWLAHAVGIGGPISVKIGDETVSGTFETIDLEGRLVVRGGDGVARPISAGDVQFGDGWDGGTLMAADDLVFVPLGGVGEIGMNLALYGYGRGRSRKWLAVDLGVAFGHEEVLPGVDAVLPDISFLMERKSDLVGIAITHAHEDHYGALFDFWPKLGAPVFMTPFAAALLQAKRQGEQNAPKIAVKVVRQGERIAAGPFEVEYVPVSHSIPEPNALAIRTPLGTVFHTGDWKLDPAPGIGRATDSDRIAAIGEEGVLALISDSTNAIRDGVSPSEGEVARVLERLVAEAPQRVAVTTFASNVARLRAVAEAAHRAGREVVIVGRAIHRAVDVARELGYLEGLPEFLDQDAYAQLPRNKVVALMTGSQGEPRAALAKVAAKDHRALSLAPGDRVIFSSRTIPGNERAVNTIINALVDFGAEVITDRDALVHTSGHPRRDEIRQLYDWLKPRIVVPVHGEALHLHEQAKLARAAGIPEVIEVRNGQMIRLAPGPAERLDSISHGRLYRDGKLLVSHDASGVVDRRRFSFAGVVSVAIVLSDSGEVLEDPVVTLMGLPEADAEGEPLRAIAEEAVDAALDGLSKAKRRAADTVREAVRRSVRGEIETAWGKKPQTIIHVTHVSD